MSDEGRSGKRRAGVPSHIIISPEGESGIKRLMGIKGLKAKDVVDSQSEAYMKVFATSAKKTETIVFDNLNIAAADLNDDEAAQLQAEGVIVAPNEERIALGWLDQSSPLSGVTGEGENSARSSYTRTRLDHRGGGGGGAGHRGGISAPRDPVGLRGHRPGVMAWDAGLEMNDRLWNYAQGQLDAWAKVLEMSESRYEPTPLAALGIKDSAELAWHLRMMDIPRDLSAFSKNEIKIAVLDTGLDLKHPDFAVPPANRRSFIPGVDSVQDGDGHGTHCCGLVAGNAKPKVLPRYGAAPTCTLLVGKVLDDSGSGYDSDILKGIAWAVNQGARVISLSLGSRRSINEKYSRVYQDIADQIEDEGRQCLIVAAAGNESNRGQHGAGIAPVGNPAACPSLLSVGAVDQDGWVADFSCGELDPIGTLDLVAPGVNIRSAFPVDRAESEPYALMSGTSMATPLVAGLAALHLQRDPKLTAAQLWRHLVRTARPAGLRRDYGSGIARYVAK